MTFLIIGLLVFSLIHVSLCATPNLKLSVVDKIGANGWKALFALVALAGLLLIIYGWRHSTIDHLYHPPVFLRSVTFLLMLVAIFLFIGSKFKTKIKDYLIHPQLMGVVVWSVAHLLSNGESRSLLLFGWLGTWAIIEMLLINNRNEGKARNISVTTKGTILHVVVSIVIYLLVFMFHQYLTGIPLVNVA